MRRSFSERMGIIKPRESLQVSCMDERLTNACWNIMVGRLFRNHALQWFHDEQMAAKIWLTYYGRRIDEIPKTSNNREVRLWPLGEMVKKDFLQSDWNRKYDLIEFIVELDEEYTKFNLQEQFNNVFKRECGGYKLINGIVTPIIEDSEISEIEEALLNKDSWEPVSKQLSQALSHLSNRENPDYRNSIKESISAVESACKIITGNKEATLGQALKELGKTHDLHQVLKTGFDKLYGFTNGQDGIRHGMLTDRKDITFEDAKFMLVACSAFVNYLKAKIAKDG